MELEKARARHSISNTQSVLIVKAEIYGLTRRERDRLPIHDKLQGAFKYDEHAFRIWMVMQAGNRIFFVDHDHRVTTLRSGCCAPAASGHAVADPTIPLMKSRRRIAFPKAQDHGELYAIRTGNCH
jgi:hypothetical protein